MVVCGLLCPCNRFSARLSLCSHMHPSSTRAHHLEARARLDDWSPSLQRSVAAAAAQAERYAKHCTDTQRSQNQIFDLVLHCSTRILHAHAGAPASVAPLPRQPAACRVAASSSHTPRRRQHRVPRSPNILAPYRSPNATAWPTTKWTQPITVAHPARPVRAPPLSTIQSAVGYFNKIRISSAKTRAQMLHS